jgi:type III restriction enzyme
MKQINQLIINSPYQEPDKYHEYIPKTKSFDLREGRRPAGYVVATEGSKSFDDPGQFIEIPLVNKIRPRVQAWRENGYPGVTGITKRLLEHWYDKSARQFGFFFCQLEAIETLIWMTEAPDADKVGIDVPSDGGDFRRLCAKMATGTGKTVVMTMVIAWQVLNKVAYPQDKRFSKNILVMAPGLTVKSRLAVLNPNEKGNYFEEFNMVPTAMMDKLRQGKVMVRNWHALQWDTEEKLQKVRSVDKRKTKPISDEAYVRQVLEDMASASNIVVLNDEAHHAWRVPAESKIKGVAKEDIEEATKWVGGLDRIHTARGILNCFDFSATPFAPSGKRSSEEALFQWIISDFGLNDAIESGLVKTPRIVVRTDAGIDTQTFKPKLYHLYPHVKDDLNRRAEPQDSLPDLIMNAYYLLGYDWRETAKSWAEQGHHVPPVMITVANRTETAARIEFAFNHQKIRIEELCVPEKTLRIDSKVMDMAESVEEPMVEIDSSNTGDDDEPAERKLTKKEEAELLRLKVDTVGQRGKPGEQIQNVISVGMLSEGWDAKTVTHIMGLRAFSSQLLCEQVVGRGLRRTSYEVNEDTGLFEAEYVNIFGVPFTFIPHESPGDTIPKPPTPKTRIEADGEKSGFEIRWPNILRVNYSFRPTLSLNLDDVEILNLNASDTILTAEMAQVIGGQPKLDSATPIQLEQLAKEQRLQKLIFETARDVYDQMKPNWHGNKEMLLAQVISVVEKFIGSDKIDIQPGLFATDPLRRRLIITMNMNKVVQHIWQAIKQENQDRIEPVFDPTYPIRSTGDMMTWYTGKPCETTKKSHINCCVCDSSWESMAAFELDSNETVEAWAKNDHLGFEIMYLHEGVLKKYRPDFLVKMKSGKFLIVETKGQDSTSVQSKKKAAEEWVKAVNAHKGFGKWDYAIHYSPDGLKDVLANA